MERVTQSKSLVCSSHPVILLSLNWIWSPYNILILQWLQTQLISGRMDHQFHWHLHFPAGRLCYFLHSWESGPWAWGGCQGCCWLWPWAGLCQLPLCSGKVWCCATIILSSVFPDVDHSWSWICHRTNNWGYHSILWHVSKHKQGKAFKGEIWKHLFYFRH